MSRALQSILGLTGRVSSGSGTKLDAAQMKTEVLSGLTVALALVPEAVAFAFVAGVHPLVGLYAAFIVGLITAYSASVLKSWKRARVMGGLLAGLYALLFVLLSLEAWSLLIGSLVTGCGIGVGWHRRRKKRRRASTAGNG